MDLDPVLLRAFRETLRKARETRRDAWEGTGRLVGRAQFPRTVDQLIRAIQSSTDLAAPLRDALLASLREAARPEARGSTDRLRLLTGLPRSKAIRALCLRFHVGGTPAGGRLPAPLAPEQIEAFVRRHPNPYDLLLEDERPSVLDLGAGDLSFAADVAARYLPRLQERGRPLALHCVERLSPSSKWGSPLHADPEYLARLERPSPGLEFRFWTGQDMLAAGAMPGARTRYTIAVCNAPATPTFAYEPARLSRPVYERHLRDTKGAFRRVRLEGEEALEVLHRGRALIFPPWKFDVHGPLALLDLMSRKGSLCVLAAVDAEVFWELLAQLLAEERFRPLDRLFTAEHLPDVFGDLYDRLSGLPIGQRVDLSTLAALRPRLPHVLTDRPPAPRRFRYVELRRGAEHPEIPAGGTARAYRHMTEEAPPWLVLLVPEPA